MDFALARQMMVDSQVRPNGVTDLRIVSAFLDVGREVFVPGRHAALAYLDRDLPIGDAGGPPGRVLIKPMVLAKLIQAAEFNAGEDVLVVGCGTGYSAALVARLAGHVVALEEDAGLATAASKALTGLANVEAVRGPLADGWSARAPYDAILVDGGLERLPEPLLHQLKDRGRIVGILMDGPMGKGTVWRVAGGHVSSHSIFDASEPVLPGFSRAKAFVF